MEEFISLYEILDKQCRYYCRHLGHLKGLLENDDWMRVVDESMSGRALLLGNSEITNALILFNTRMFDRQNDTITLRKLSKSLPSIDELQQHHIARMERIGIEYEVERYFEERENFIRANKKLKRSETEQKLRHLRDHTLAHNLRNPETEPERATYNDLIELTWAVFDLVDMAGYMVESSRHVYRDFTSRSEKETRMLLAALPKLSAVESE